LHIHPSPLNRASHEELNRLIEFAKAASVPDGFGFLDRFGKVDKGRSPACFVTARMTYCFSLASLLEVPDVSRYAAHGVACLSGPFWDESFGGYLSSLDGKPSSQRKRAYETCFVALGASAAATAGIPGAEELTAKVSDVLQTRFWSNEAGALFESWDREFAEPVPRCHGSQRPRFVGHGRLEPPAGSFASARRSELDELLYFPEIRRLALTSAIAREIMSVFKPLNEWSHTNLSSSSFD
jgi:mannose/cellobiose epimerase-like protein (N-acyl-D-glucosamine 2-epimerase family)